MYWEDRAKKENRPMTFFEYLLESSVKAFYNSIEIFVFFGVVLSIYLFIKKWR